MRVSDFSMLWTPKLDSVGGSYNGQLSRLHWSLIQKRVPLVMHQERALSDVQAHRDLRHQGGHEQGKRPEHKESVNGLNRQGPRGR